MTAVDQAQLATTCRAHLAALGGIACLELMREVQEPIVSSNLELLQHYEDNLLEWEQREEAVLAVHLVAHGAVRSGPSTLSACWASAAWSSGGKPSWRSTWSGSVPLRTGATTLSASGAAARGSSGG